MRKSLILAATLLTMAALSACSMMHKDADTSGSSMSSSSSSSSM